MRQFLTLLIATLVICLGLQSCQCYYGSQAQRVKQALQVLKADPETTTVIERDTILLGRLETRAAWQFDPTIINLQPQIFTHSTDTVETKVTIYRDSVKTETVVKPYPVEVVKTVVVPKVVSNNRQPGIWIAGAVGLVVGVLGTLAVFVWAVGKK